MSQIQILDAASGNPQIPTTFITDSGDAIPVANELEILGDVVANSGVPVETVGSGNTVTVSVQVADAIAATDISAVGLAAFDSASFAVDANGFVSFTGTMTGIDSINVDTFTAPGTDPVVPDGTGLITMSGRQVASHTVGANVLQTNSLAVNSFVYEIQQSGAVAGINTTYNGVCHFDSADFTVTNGFVSLVGSPIETLTGDTGSATGSNVTLYANNAANNSGATVKFVNGGSTSTLNLTDTTLRNTFIGNGAGKTTVTGTDNCGIGYLNLGSVTTATGNTSVGRAACQSIQGGASNSVLGNAALASNVNGSWNIAIGESALATTTGNWSTAVGYRALQTFNGSGNTAVGYNAAPLATGTGLTCIGFLSLSNNSSGVANTACGDTCLGSVTTGGYNTAIGYQAGSAYTGAEASNICIGVVSGTLGESNVTRIGATGTGNGQQTKCHIGGTIVTTAGRICNVTTPGAYPYTTVNTDYVIKVDTSVARTINLIASPETGRTYIIKDTVGSAAANNITISPAAGTIDGAASATININYGSATLVYTGSAWSLI